MATQFGAVSGTEVTRCSFRHHLCQNCFFLFPFLLSDCLIWPEKKYNREWQVKKGMIWKHRWWLMAESVQYRNKNSHSKFNFMQKKHTAQSNRNNVRHYWNTVYFWGTNTDINFVSSNKIGPIRKMSTATDKHRTVRRENVSLTSANFKMSFRIWHRSNKPHRRAKSCYIQYEVVNHINIYIYIYAF